MSDDLRQWMTIVEAQYDTRLYHATTIDGLYEILDSDEIKPNTGHPITHTGGPQRSRHWAIRPGDISRNGYLKGVSLTRNLWFARSWKHDGVILVLDAALIRQRLRLLPLSFFGQRRTITDEAEEFVVGSIKPVSKFLIEIQVSQQTYDTHSLLASIDSLFAFQPKLTIIGQRWKNVGLDKGSVVK